MNEQVKVAVVPRAGIDGVLVELEANTARLGDILETTAEARDQILAALPTVQTAEQLAPTVQAAASVAPDVHLAAGLLPQIQAGMAAVMTASQTVTSLSGTAVDQVDPETGVRVTGVQFGHGSGVLIQPVVAFDGAVLVTGYTFGGLL